jgi:hypothetical protein
MKTVTIKRIPFGPYIKWSVIGYTIYGIISGSFEVIFTYLATRADLGRIVLWYGVRGAAIYIAVGLCGGSLFIFIYNNFISSVGGYRFEIDLGEEKIQVPPPPPNNFD